MQVEANGISIGYDLAGPDGAPVVMLSHSLGSSRVMWAPQLAVLGERYRVLSYDTRGHGDTSTPAASYTLGQLAEDAVALMDALAIPKVHWLGLSMGGMIGQALALDHGSRLLSLTLCDTTSRIPAEAVPMWEDRIAAARQEGMAALVEATMQRWFTPDYLRADQNDVAPIRAQFLATAPDGFIGCCEAIKSLDFVDRLAEIALPTLIIVGEDDPGTPVAASEAMNAHIAGSDLVVLPSASHLSNIEQAGPFTAAVTAFLDRVQDG